jgi:hypothetical protein
VSAFLQGVEAVGVIPADPLTPALSRGEREGNWRKALSPGGRGSDTGERLHSLREKERHGREAPFPEEEGATLERDFIC